MLLKTTTTLACALSLAGAFLTPTKAHAILCDDVVDNVSANKIYGVGGSAVTATLKRIQRAIEEDPTKTADRPAIFYHDGLAACAGYAAFLSGSVEGNFRYWVAGTNTDQLCEARAGGQPVVFSHMGNDVSFCPDGQLPNDVGDFVAPIQTLNLIADVKSDQQAISAEAVYFIYGFGQTGQASPWTDGTGVYKRQFDSFASLFFAAAIDVPSTAFKWGPTELGAGITNERATQADVASAITAYGTTEELARQTLGYVSGSAADSRRTTHRTLAYKHYGQDEAVYPDSTVASFDKINVRTGKYFLWAPGHYFTRVDTSGVPLEEDVENLIGWFSAKTTAPGTAVNAFEQSIQAGDIPQCAMQATREGTVGALHCYAPPKPCSCYFEHTTNPNVTSACTPCVEDANCGGETPSCNFGYCEAYRADGEVEG